MFQIVFKSNGNKSVDFAEATNLLRASLKASGGIPFKCGGGHCGTCRCKIEEGLENTDKVKTKELKHLTEEDVQQGYRMACQTFVEGSIVVSWEKSSK